MRTKNPTPECTSICANGNAEAYVIHQSIILIHIYVQIPKTRAIGRNKNPNIPVSAVPSIIIGTIGTMMILIGSDTSEIIPVVQSKNGDTDIVAAQVVATIPRIPHRSGTRVMRFSKIGEINTTPSVAIKESWNDLSKHKRYGLMISIVSAVKHNACPIAYGLPTSRATSMRLPIIPARTAVACAPERITKSTIAKIPHPSEIMYGKNDANTFIVVSATIEILYPDNATICIVPVLMNISV